MKIGLAIVIVAVIGAAAALYGYTQSEFTQCFAQFDSPQAASRAAEGARAAGYDTDVEASGPKARLRGSPGGRGISVLFSDGETGSDGARFRTTFHELVDQEDGHLGHPGGGCLERPHFN